MKGLIYVFKRYKVASLLNLVGMIVAFAVCFVLLTQVCFQRNYNKSFDNYEQLCRLESVIWYDKWSTFINRPLCEFLTSLPQLESVATFCPYTETNYFEKDGGLISEQCCRMLPTTLTTFRAKCIDGRLELHDNEDGVIIPASVALKYFGDTMVAGRYFVMVERDSKHRLPIVGVYEDFPANVSMGNYCYMSLMSENVGVFNNWNYTCVIRLKDNVDVASYESVILGEIRRFYKQTSDDNGWEMDDESLDSMRFRLVPIADTYMSGVSEDDKGDPTVILMLQLSFLLIIVVAAINFANFTLAEAPMRIKSVNTRKVLGSSSLALRLSLIGEGVLVSLVAYLISLVMVSQLALMPSVNDIVLGSISVADNILVALVMLVVALLLGVLTSIYPAFYVTSFSPALVLKGAFGLSPRGRALRMFLICFQFVAAIGMVVYMSVLYMQSNYIYKSDYGFDKNALMGCALNGRVPGAQLEALRQELLNIGAVEDVSYASCALGVRDGGTTWGRSSAINPEVTINYMANFVDSHFFNTYGLELVEGSASSSVSGYYFVPNEAFVHNYPGLAVIDKPLNMGEECVVTGICRDARFCTARVDRHSQSVVFVVDNRPVGEGSFMRVLAVRVAAGSDLFEARRDVENVISQFAIDMPRVVFLDEEIENAYQDEFRFITQITWFAMVALVITLIGVFCLTLFETEYRRKEIGVRKVMGATMGEVVNMFVKKYLLLLIVSYVIATPVAYVMSVRWLEGFSEHVALGWQPFALSFVLVSGLTVVIVTLKTMMASMENPTESIKC
ncbi:MAG: FtsX-like permease family protein [Bacteroidales bacterium]|nr:FtsX-like permease family protein [Bacteroidales bacterium]